MARRPNVDAVYHAADVFRNRCLSGGTSLLWANRRAWTDPNLQSLWAFLMEHPDISERSFFEKLRDQLSGAGDDECRIAADILAFYYLFPDRTGAEKKLARIREVVAWKGLFEGLDTSIIEAAYAQKGIGFPGTYYNTGLPWLFAFMIKLGQEALRSKPDLSNAAALDELTLRAAGQIGQNVGVMRNVALHLVVSWLALVGADQGAL